MASGSIPANAEAAVGSIHDAVRSFNIAPGIVDSVAGTIQVAVSLSGTHISPGTHIEPSITQGDVDVVLTAARDGPMVPSTARFVVVYVDPDLPPNFSQYVHGVACNVSLGANAFDCTLLRGFRPSGPPANTGKHRYTFLAFAQPPGFDATAAAAALPATGGFDVRAFATAFHLGPCLGANFFTASYDGSCRASLLSCLMCFCCATPPTEDWAERDAARAEAKAATGAGK